MSCFPGQSQSPRAPGDQPVFRAATNSSSHPIHTVLLRCFPPKEPLPLFLYFYFPLLISFPGIWSVLSPPQCQQQTQPGYSRPLPTVPGWEFQAAAQVSLNMDLQKFSSLCWNWSICRSTAYQYSYLIVQTQLPVVITPLDCSTFFPMMIRHVQPIIPKSIPRDLCPEPSAFSVSEQSSQH